MNYLQKEWEDLDPLMRWALPRVGGTPKITIEKPGLGTIFEWPST
jgi:hypothetical protein